MKYLKCFLTVLAVLSLTACHDTWFESTWQNPSASAVDLRTESVGAFLLSGNEAVRRSFEFNLANQLNKRGIEAIPGYELTPHSDVTNKEEILTDLMGTGVDHAVFMKIVDRTEEVNYVPGSVWYAGPYYDPFYWRDGAFIGPWGFGGTWPPYYDPGYYRVDTIVSVETLVYSVPDRTLLWTGLSKTMNPSEVDKFVKSLASETVKEMKKTGLVGRES
jgi:hypothetical protein